MTLRSRLVPSLRRMALLSFGATALLATALSLRATTVIPPEFPELVDRADYIVRAVVTSVDSEWRETDGRRFIVTKVTLDVKEVIKGTPPAQPVLEVLGGQIGSDRLEVSGAPQFYVGDEDVLFVKDNGRTVVPLVGFMHGQYPVIKNAKTGVRSVLRSNGMPLYSEQDVSLPLEKLSALKAKDSRVQPLTSEEFSQKIRSARATSRREK